MKPFVLPITLAAGIGMGFVLDERARTGPKADGGTEARVVQATAQPETEETDGGTKGGADSVGAESAASLKELLAGFDRGKPVESHLMMLRRVMTASPAELAELVKKMAGPWRSVPGWTQIRTAVMQRWVELAPGEAVAWARVAEKHGDNASQAAEIFGMLASVDPTRAMAEAQDLTNPMLKNRAVRSVIASISQTDPEQAFRLSQSLPGNQRGSVYFDLFRNWADRDPSAAAAGLLTLKNRNDRGQASWSLMSRWASQDPAAAMAWAKGLTEPALRQGALQAYFRTLGERDPESAIAEISGFPKYQQREFLSNVLSSWMGTDPEAASAWAMARPNGTEKQQLIAVAVGNLGHLAGEKGSLLVSQLPQGSARDNAMRQVVDQWMWSDPDAAIAFTRTLTEGEELKLREAVVQGLAYLDPEKAMAYLKEKPLDDPASAVWGQLSRTLASGDSPAKALEWANALPDESSRRAALPGIFSQMARNDPAEAAKQAAALPDGAARLECLSTVAGAWAVTGMDEALAWAKGLSGKDAEAAMGAVLQKGAPHQPTAAADQFNTLMAGVPAGTRPADALVAAAGTIATAYFAENQQAAAHWAASLPQDEARAAAVTSLTQQWAQYDPAGASEWIGTLPDGRPRDAAVGQLVGRIAPSDPAAAFAWADTVTDTGDRSNLLQTTIASWRKLDAPAARTAIEATDWPQEEKTKWIEKVK